MPRCWAMRSISRPRWRWSSISCFSMTTGSPQLTQVLLQLGEARCKYGLGPLQRASDRCIEHARKPEKKRRKNGNDGNALIPHQQHDQRDDQHHSQAQTKYQSLGEEQQPQSPLLFERQLIAEQFQPCSTGCDQRGRKIPQGGEEPSATRLMRHAGLTATEDETHQEADTRTDTDRLPRILMHIGIGGARRRAALGYQYGLRIREANPGIVEAFLDARAQAGDLFARLVCGDMQDVFRICNDGLHIGDQFFLRPDASFVDF